MKLIQAAINKCAIARLPACAISVHLLAVACGPLKAEQSAAEIQELALSARRSIKSGVVMLVSRYRVPNGSVDTTRTVYFNGAKIRGDTVKPYGVSPPAAHSDKYTDVSCFGCYSNEMHFSCTDKITEDGLTLVASITDRNHVSEDADYVPDPRWVGFIPIDSFGMRNYHMDYVVGGKGSETARVVRENLNGQECQRLEFKRPWGSTARLWIAAAAGYSVVRNEVEFDNGEIHYVDRVDVDVEKHLASGIWFPTKAHFERRETRAGATEVTMEEKLAIDVRQLNEPVAPSVFSLGGIEILKPGTKIMWVSDRPPPVVGAQMLEWNGEKLVAARGLVPQRARQGEVNRLPLFYFNCAVVAALVAGVALRRHYRLRGAEASKSTQCVRRART